MDGGKKGIEFRFDLYKIHVLVRLKPNNIGIFITIGQHNIVP